MSRIRPDSACRAGRCRSSRRREVGEARRGVLVRDTKDRTGQMLRFTPGAWRRFADQVKRLLAS